MTNFCLKNQTFCVKGPEKKSKFSKICLEKSIFFTRIHDLPRFQTRLTPLDILSTNAVPNLNLLGPLYLCFKYIVLANLGPFRTFSRAAWGTPVHLCVTHIKKFLNSQPGPRPPRQSSASPQWAAAHRLRTAVLECVRSTSFVWFLLCV